MHARSPHGVVRPANVDRLWLVSRWSAMGAVVLLLVGLLVVPDRALTLLWYVVVPILPATFFLNPILWRGICPLATANTWGNQLAEGASPSPVAAARLGVGSVLLFHLLVPARHLVFNQNGGVLAATIAVVALLALVLGARYAVRSGFCNTLCPVLPVELTYGQAPLLSLTRGRCDSCTACVGRGCLDLAPGKAFMQAMGPARRTDRWLATPLGLFVAALPGFVVGYGVLADGPWASAPQVYGTTMGASVASVALVAVLLRVVRVPSSVLLPVLAAAAGGLYYWFAGPAIARELSASRAIALSIQVAGIALSAAWLLRALTREGVTLRARP